MTGASSGLARRSRGGVVLYVLAAIALLVLFALWWDRHRAIPRAPGVLAPDAPVQRKLDAPPQPIERAGFRITQVATFALTARVLSRADYHFGTASALSPTDLVFGWGRMSDSSVLARIDISQSSRWYRWRTLAPPIPRREIETSSANMHLIPADAGVAHALAEVQEGDVVQLEGELVNVEQPGSGWRWVSSLSREDIGAGACELIWVESLAVEQ